MKKKYRFFGQAACGKKIKEVIMAPDDDTALRKVPEICRRRGITLDPARDRLVRIVRPGVETVPVPLAA